jgi:hypothetical protein
VSGIIPRPAWHWVGILPVSFMTSSGNQAAPTAFKPPTHMGHIRWQPFWFPLLVGPDGQLEKVNFLQGPEELPSKEVPTRNSSVWEGGGGGGSKSSGVLSTCCCGFSHGQGWTNSEKSAWDNMKDLSLTSQQSWHTTAGTIKTETHMVYHKAQLQLKHFIITIPTQYWSGTVNSPSWNWLNNSAGSRWYWR